MSFGAALYQLCFGPLELLFEILFFISHKILGSYGLSIISLSLMMNFLVLPLYKRADALQEAQRQTEQKLKKWVTHIKKTFKGDERFMMLQTFYRQNHYHPSSVLKGSLSLLLEIPFFIAAFHFLSHANLFNGYSFGPFSDMSRPDGLIKIGSLSVNLLPILMTLINLLSSFIYSRGLPASGKIQLYGMAGIFFVLLYRSPSALVFYWTLNNLFSLFKNIFYKFKHPKLVLSILASLTGLVSFGLLGLHRTNRVKLFIVLLAFALQIPLLVHLLKKRIQFQIPEPTITRTDRLSFWLGALFLSLFIGGLIPSSVINSSPEEFINMQSLASPLHYLTASLTLAIGTFLITFGLFYLLANPKGKKGIALAFCILSISALINYMCFGKNPSLLSPFLSFEIGLRFSGKAVFLNLLALLPAVAVTAALFFNRRTQKLFPVLLTVCLLALLPMLTLNTVSAHQTVKQKIANLIQNDSDNSPQIPLSTKGKNVLILMSDRAINSYLPYIFNEKPEVAKQFDGFTYYPNTLSFGGHTNFGLPAVFGGYEYTPFEMNRRSNESLESKHNEALKVLPVLFHRAGFRVTVCDPSYAGYDQIPDLSIYNDYPGIHSFITKGKVGISITEGEAAKREARRIQSLNRNFFVYALMKSCPLAVQPFLYSGGSYCKLSLPSQICQNLHQAKGIDSGFLQNFQILRNLPSMTVIHDDSTPTFMMMCNETTHSPCLLQEPDYLPAEQVDNRAFDAHNRQRFTVNGKIIKMETLLQMRHYHANMAAMMQLGNYFDFLREHHLYDNTKIIIVADHGFELSQFDNLRLGTGLGEDIMRYNPLLMVKDFNSTRRMTDPAFMTQADVPSLATDRCIPNPVNPFTGKALSQSPKTETTPFVFLSHDWQIAVNNGNTFLPGRWYAVANQNCLDRNNWKEIPDPSLSAP